MKFYDGAAPNPRRVRIFLAEKGVEVPTERLDIPKNEARSPAFLKKNSLGAVPVLELDDGTIITESVAICRYFEELYPDPPLFGADAVERAKVEMWNRRIEIEIMTNIGAVALHTFDFFKDRVMQVPAYAEAQRETSMKKLAWLDGELADGRPYLTGDRFSVADITGMTASMIAGFVGIEIPEELSNLRRWDDRLRSRPSWDA